MSIVSRALQQARSQAVRLPAKVEGRYEGPSSRQLMGTAGSQVGAEVIKPTFPAPPESLLQKALGAPGQKKTTAGECGANGAGGGT